MAIKHDCASYNPNEQICVALTEMVCRRSSVCPFYITKKEAERKRKKAEERLNMVWRERIEKRREAVERGTVKYYDRRQNLKERGLCVRCGKPNDRAETGGSVCLACLEQMKNTARERRKRPDGE